jgi:tape measure domain-containing protein
VAVANIAIEVNGQQAANALKQITTASRQLEGAVGSTTAKVNNQNAATNSASNQLKNYTRSTQAATAATNKLKGAASNLLGAFAAISAAKFVFAKTAELQTQTKSLEVLTGSASKANQIIKELQQLGAVTPFTSTELIDSAKRLNAFGVEGDKVVGTTRRLADVAGATGAELQGLVTAYGQVQAKGRLQGEELLQFQERGVALQEELRKMYGLSGEEFQKALSKGRISAEAVAVAIQRLTDAGGKYANGAVAQSGTLQGKFSTLQDSVDELARVIGQKLAPALSSFIDNTTGVVKAITDLPDPVKNATGELIKFGLQFLVVKKAIEAVIAIRAAYVGAVAAITVATAASGTAATTSAGAFALYTTNVRTLQAASIATAGSVSGLTAALLGLAGIGVVTVAINYVITQTGAILGSAEAAQKSLAARSQQSLAGQLKGKTIEERQKMLKTTQKNLANDRKLASTLALQIRSQEAAMIGPGEGPMPSDRARLIELQARVKTNEARIKAITSMPIEKLKKPELPPTPGLLGETGSGKTGSSKADRAAKKTVEEAKKAAEQAQQQLDSASKLKDIAAANLDIQVSMNDAERLKGEFDKAAVERRMQYLELQKNAKSPQERELLLSAQLSEIQIANNKYAKDKKALLDQQLKPLEDIIAANKTKLEDDKAYQRLVAEGINPELAKQYIEIDRAGKALQEALQPAIDLAKVAVVEAEARGASADEVARLRKELEGLQQLPGQKAEEARKGAEAANKPKTFQEGIAGERDKVKKDLEELTNLTNVVNFGAKTIGDSFAASFKGIISGTMGAKEALASFFQSVADAFLDMAAQIIAKWIQMTILNSVLSIFPGGGAGSGGGFGAGGAGFGGSNAFGSFDAGGGLAFGGGFSLLPGRAMGGPVSAGTPYMVGERGPELFMPRQGGSIIPNNALGGGSTNVVVNVDASGSNVQGDQAQAKQLGVAVSAAVQAELVKQQRPGGLLAGTRR